MERQQHEDWSKQPQPPRPRQQMRSPKAAIGLGKTGWTLTLVVLGSAWAVVVAIAVTAVSGLLSPNASNGQHPPGAATIRDTTETGRTNSQARLPLWLFGAIVLSCAAGSMLIAKQASHPPRPRKSTKVKRLAPYAAPVPQPASSPVRQPQQFSPPAVPSFVLHPVHRQPPSTTTTPSAAPTLMQLAHQEAQSSVRQTSVRQVSVRQTDVSVTVVPSDDQHPLDWGEASLSDKLNIRKPRSISSLL